jgi:hypothetical protein
VTLKPAPPDAEALQMRALIGLLIAVGAAALFLGAGGPELKGHVGLLAAAVGGGVIAFRGVVN